MVRFSPEIAPAFFLEGCSMVSSRRALWLFWTFDRKKDYPQMLDDKS